MKKELITQLHKRFEDYAHQNDGVEFWFAREMQELLGYTEWRNFNLVIEKAKTACSNAKNKIEDHFVDVNKMVDVGSGSKREIQDIVLTRYACYLIAQNGDPKKDEIAFAMTYFAVQTRKQEIIEKRIAEWERLQAREKLTLSEKELSRIIYERGIDDKGFARIRSRGDAALFGGKTTLEMKSMLNVSANRALADFLPTVIIKAKDFATEVTNVQVIQQNLRSEKNVTREHVKNNLDVRKILTDRKIVPELLPPAEDVKKLERRLKAEEKELPRQIARLKK